MNAPSDIDDRFDRTVAAIYDRVNPTRCWDYKQRPHVEPFELAHGRQCVLLGTFMRNTARFARGDVGMLWISNGQGERGEVYAWSSKVQAFVNGLYVQYARFTGRAHFHATGDGARMHQRYDRSPFNVVDCEALPGEISFEPWFHPAVRSFAIAALRVALAGCAVDTITGAAISEISSTTTDDVAR